MSRTGLILLLLLFPLPGSTNQEANPQHTFRVYEQDGITVAETNGGPKYVEELFQYEEVLRLKQDENIIESLLTQPRTIMMDDEGAFYVEDGRVNRIVRFDASGNYVCDIGRQGEGPGEYQLPRVECIQNGLLVVRDFRLNRISWFRNDGTFVDSSPLPPRLEMVIQRLRLGPHDERILLGDYQRGLGTQNEYRYNIAVAMVLSTAGDPLALVASDSVKIATQFRVPELNTRSFVWIFFSAWPRILYHPAHGLVMTTGLEPVFQCFGLDGQLQKEIHLDIPPESVTRAERNAVRSYLRSRILEAEDERSLAIYQGQLDNAEFQDPKAFFTITFIDDHGFLWATRADAGLLSSAAADRNPTTCLLFSQEGEYLGNTVLPGRNVQHTRDHVISIQENEETGVMEVIVYSIRPIASGFRYP